DEAIRLDQMLLLAPARHRKILHRRAPLIERGVEEPTDAFALPFLLCVIRRLRARGGVGGRGALGLEHERQAIEKLPHGWREDGGELVERRRDVLLKGGRREALDERAAEIERAQLRERETGGVQPPERLGFESPVALAVDHFVEQRKPGRLQRFEIAADR